MTFTVTITPATLREAATFVLMVGGALFVLLAGLGILRMPDTFLRMSATSKASTLGMGMVLLGAVVHYADNLGVVTRLLVIIVFQFLTTPIGAHMLGRSAYLRADPNDEPVYWDKTVVDELKDRYNRDTGDLASHSPIARGDGLPEH